MERSWVEALGILAEFDDTTLYEPDLICGVVDRKLSAVSELLSVDPQDTGAEGVKGRDPHLPRIVADEERHPVLHLLCSLIRKGDRQYLVGLREPLVYEVSDPV